MCHACALSVREASQRARSLEGEKFRRVMTQDDRAVDPGDERGEMATVNPFRVTGTSLGHTDVKNECQSQECTASEHWQPGVSSSLTSVPRNGRKVALKPMMGHWRKIVSMFPFEKKFDVRFIVARGRTSKKLCRVI